MAGRTAGAVCMCGLQFHDGAKINIYPELSRYWMLTVDRCRKLLLLVASGALLPGCLLFPPTKISQTMP